ncbi:MAG: hypothetical protein WAN72_07290 [Candidatus Acidiferrales bacterium]
MNARKNHQAMAQITRRGLLLAALLATAFAGASISGAQSTKQAIQAPLQLQRMGRPPAASSRRPLPKNRTPRALTKG